MDLTELLAFVVKNKASDLHLSSGLPPMIRVHGDVRRINVPPLEHKDVHGMIYDIMNDAQRKHYEENLECDFSFAIPNLARFPRIGRPYLDNPPQSAEALAQLAALPAGAAASLREYLHGNYVMLYTTMDANATVYLLSIRHHRQLSFDFARLWPGSS